MSYLIKINKVLDKPHNKLSTENNGRSPRKIQISFESDNVLYSDVDGYSDGYLDGYSDGYSSVSNNSITLYGEDINGNQISDTIYLNKNGVYKFENVLFSSLISLEGYLNIKDIYEEPCVISISEVSPITVRDSEEGSVAYVYGESNGDLIISSRE
jgi:hypothetical protein